MITSGRMKNTIPPGTGTRGCGESATSLEASAEARPRTRTLHARPWSCSTRSTSNETIDPGINSDSRPGPIRTNIPGSWKVKFSGTTRGDCRPVYRQPTDVIFLRGHRQKPSTLRWCENLQPRWSIHIAHAWPLDHHPLLAIDSSNMPPLSSEGEKDLRCHPSRGVGEGPSASIDRSAA